MNIGLAIFLTDYSIDVAVVAHRAEQMGFDSLWLPEHPIIPVQFSSPVTFTDDGKLPKYYYDTVDPFVALGKAAGATKTLKLATGVCLVPERNPLLLAKEVATLDLISGGRFIFGIGAGWLKEETEIMGGDFEHRWGQTKDSVLAMKELWTKTRSEYHGKYYDFPPVYSFPRPVQRPHPPIVLGGKAARVFERVVGWGDGWLPTLISPAELGEGRQKLNRLAEAAGRDPQTIEVSAFWQTPDPDLVKGHEKAGAKRVIVPLRSEGEKEVLAQMDDVARKLL
ncbi:MAG: LLM class F420-dependent oxidoreductase [SAR202 cluster bacterium]|nr:LLM class F420-dependent oxidoreductase [SAR202 cluster bacterium]